MIFSRKADSRRPPAAAAASTASRSSGASIAPYLITSARPLRNCSSGSVSRKARSMKTSFGWWNVPRMFLPASVSTPVFPPMLLSTWARRVVGIWMTGIPRMKIEAVKPVRSPMTPPPRAISAVDRSAPRAISFSTTERTVCIPFAASPGGTVIRSTRRSVFFKAASTLSPWRASMWVSVTMTYFSAQLFFARISPIRSRIFSPMWIS